MQTDDKMTVNQKQLTEILGVSDKWIIKLTNENGLPKIARGKYDLPAVVQWWTEYQKQTVENKYAELESSYDRERTRNMKIQGDRNELKLQEMRKQLIGAETVKSEVGNVFGVIRQRLLNLPKKIGPIILSFKDANEAREYFEKLIHDVLKELSEINFRRSA